MYIVTSICGIVDRCGAEVVIVTCQACGYYEEHFTDRSLSKVEKMWDWCGK